MKFRRRDQNYKNNHRQRDPSQKEGEIQCNLNLTLKGGFEKGKYKQEPISHFSEGDVMISTNIII